MLLDHLAYQSRSKIGRMTQSVQNKLAIQRLIQVVWTDGDLARLEEFWTQDCVNHAAPRSPKGLAALRTYHEQFSAAFAPFSEVHIGIEQQVAENDKVVSHIVTKARHTATGKNVSLTTIRIDKMHDDKIAEHWSVADMAGLMQQMQ